MPTDLAAKAPSPIRACATAARARNAGYSHPPFGTLNTQPFGAWMANAPKSTGRSAQRPFEKLVRSRERWGGASLGGDTGFGTDATDRRGHPRGGPTIS